LYELSVFLPLHSQQILLRLDESPYSKFGSGSWSRLNADPVQIWIRNLVLQCCFVQVRTPFGGVVTGLIIILTCVVLSPYLAYIPTSVLSAVIIFSMFSTIAYKLPYKLWKSQRKQILLIILCNYEL
jgi:hypothetical protein